MAPESGNGGLNGSPIKADRVLDLDAMVPAPLRQYRVKIGGAEYPVRQIIHLTGQEEMDLTALDRAVDTVIATKGATGQQLRRAMFDRAFHLVRILVPGLSEHARNQLTYDQANTIAGEAWQYAISENPPSAATETSAPAPEVNSSPVSAAPMESIPAA